MAYNYLSRSCPACEQADVATTPYSVDQWKIVACATCEFVFLQNPPEYEALESDFAFEKTYLEEAKRRDEAEPILNAVSKATAWLREDIFKRDKPLWLLNKYARDGDIVVDIGCGDGSKLATAARKLKQRRGINIIPFGVDISIDSAKAADENLQPYGGRCLQNNAIGGLASLPDAHTNCIQMRAFLEHEVNPVGLLEQTFRVLKPGGVTIIKVPNYASLNRRVRQGRWCGFRYPDHVNYFTPENLQQMLVDQGFHIDRMTLLDRFPLSDNMYLVGRKPA